MHLPGPWAPGVVLTQRLKGGWALELQKLDFQATLPARFALWLMLDGRRAGWPMGGSRSHRGAQLGFRLGSSGEIVGVREMHLYASAPDLVSGRGRGSWPWAPGLTAGVGVGFTGTVVPGLACECLRVHTRRAEREVGMGLVRSFPHILKRFIDSPKSPEHCCVARDTHRNTGRQGTRGAARPPRSRGLCARFLPLLSSANRRPASQVSLIR